MVEVHCSPHIVSFYRFMCYNSWSIDVRWQVEQKRWGSPLCHERCSIFQTLIPPHDHDKTINRQEEHHVQSCFDDRYDIQHA